MVFIFKIYKCVQDYIFKVAINKYYILIELANIISQILILTNFKKIIRYIKYK